MTRKDLPSPQALRKLLRYDPDTGKLFWRERPPSMFKDERICKSWNCRFSGKQAMFYVNSNGYMRGNVLRKSLYAHQVIWAMIYGEYPSMIDHIDGDRLNNRATNLREVTYSDNAKNSASRSPKSGHMGVYWYEPTKKWRSAIGVKGKLISLGYYETLEDALRARILAEAEYGFHPNHGRR